MGQSDPRGIYESSKAKRGVTPLPNPTWKTSTTCTSASSIYQTDTAELLLISIINVDTSLGANRPGADALDPSSTSNRVPDKVAGVLWTKPAAPSQETVSPSASPAPRPHTSVPMTQPSSLPPLTPQFCFSTTVLRDFLRLSRGTIDDTITQNLNALATPSRAGFDPTSTSRLARPATRQIDASSCEAFKNQVLFPSWQSRSDVLSYCTLVATSPDPDDPEATLRETEKEKNRERVVDERLDPYSSRFFPREARTEQLATILRQEMGVENIVRARSWGIVRERCGDIENSWEDALARWRKLHTAS